jgi:hypothetical protein
MRRTLAPTTEQIANSSLRKDLVQRVSSLGQEQSLLKRFDKMELKTPAQGGLLNSVKREAPKFGLTTVIEVMEELELSSKRKQQRKSKDDFGVTL